LTERVGSSAGHFERQLETKVDEITLNVPKLRRLPFEIASIEWYRRRVVSVEEASVEMYPAGVSVRRVEDIAEALSDTRVKSGTVSHPIQPVHTQIETWRSAATENSHPHVFLVGSRAEAQLGRQAA
jgi:transposase-like protein